MVENQDVGRVGKPTGHSQVEPASGLQPSAFDPSRVAEALAQVPPGWWWSVGVCSVSCDASIGPDVAYCDKATLIAFDNGFHADLEQPSTVADAVLDVCEQARKAIAARAA